MSSLPCDKQRGMTLLEVMVALVIFSLTATAIMKAAGEHLSAIGQIEEITFATWVANNRLTQIYLDPSWPPKNKHQGSQGMADRTWYWQQNVQKTNDKDMLSVEIRVSLDQQFEQSITAVTSFVAKAKASK